jgi:hypothetical protein
MRKLLIGLALSVMATAVQAQWVFVGTAPNGNKWYADPTTKSRTGNVVRIWEIVDHVEPKLFDGQTYRSERALMQMDCFERTRQILKSEGFSGKMATGKWVGSNNKPSRTNVVPSDTFGWKMLNFACK